MTKHVSPEIAGTELIATNYVRAVDGAIENMVEVKGKNGWFVNSNYTSAKRHVANDDNAPRETTKKVRPKKA